MSNTIPNPWIRHLGILFLALIASSSPCQQAPSPEDPALLALLSARETAETLIGQGDHIGAADALIQSLRDCPPDRVGLADAAYGNGQMASYLFLHVMQETPAYDYLLNRIEPEKYVTDKMVKVLCYIAIGLNDEQKTEFSREASYLSSSDNLIVRVITRFYLSNPYFYDLGFTAQFAEALADEFPDLELTQTSLNFPLYSASQTGDIAEIASEIESRNAKSRSIGSWSAKMRANILQSAKALAAKSEVSREEALEPLFDAIESAPDWRERHFTLLLMKDEFDGPQAERMRDAARNVADREENTPDVLQARALLVTALSGDLRTNATDRTLLQETLGVADTLLSSGVDVAAPERVLWETWAYSIRDCASNLARSGYNAEANNLYRELAEKLPGSKIADAALAALNRDDQLPQSNDRQ